MKTMIAVVICLALSACTTASKTHTPDGKIGHSITCSGTAQSWGSCYERAGEICGTKGYVVIAGGAERGAVAGGGASSGFFGGTTMTRNMLIQCKE